MTKENTGALPTEKKTGLLTRDKHALAVAYTKHYLNSNSGIKAIVYRHSHFSKGDYNYSDANKDLEAAAYLIVYEAAIKYVCGTSKLTKEKYIDNFDFCKFAGNYLKYGLKKYLYNLNTKRLSGSLPDSDKIRKLYFKLPKIKKEQKNPDKPINFSGYNKLSKIIGVDSNEIKEVDRALTNYTISGDKELGDENSETLLSSYPDACVSLEDDVIKQNLEKKVQSVKIRIMKTFSLRDREIVREVKFQDKKDIPQLAKKHNLSPERIRQIAEEKYIFIVNKLKKNLEF
tara:strand:+ start:79 stop:939 length:861 start_codon:yes stop_codon:yes gene_type:complete